jgi:hypothetical protein
MINKTINAQELKSVVYQLGTTKSVLTKNELLATGASQTQINELVHLGVLYPSAQGIYMPENADFQEFHTEVEVAAKFPHTVICLLGALSFHNLTTQNDTFDGKILATAIKTTFENRKTPIPDQVPIGLTQKFLEYRPTRENQWQKFGNRQDNQPTLSKAIALIAEFVLPPLQAAAKDLEFNQNWQPQLGWQKQKLDLTTTKF